MAIPPSPRFTPRSLLLLLPLLFMLGSGTPGSAAEIPVVLAGPVSAPPASGPYPASVKDPIAGVTYAWAVAPGTGTLLETTSTGHSATFMTGTGDRTLLTCKAQNPANGETGAGSHEVLHLTPGPVPPVTIEGPRKARPDQGPLLAWVAKPAGDLTYVWEVEGGERLSSPYKPYVLFQPGNGTEAVLKCTVAKDRIIVKEAEHRVLLVEQAPVPAPASFSLAHPRFASAGQTDLAVQVEGADEKGFSFDWILEGGRLTEVAEGSARLAAGSGDAVLVRCLVTNRATGAMELAEARIALKPPLERPRMAFPERVYQDQSKIVKVTNIPADGQSMYTWTSEELTILEPDCAGSSKGECHFRAHHEGEATLTCRVNEMQTGEEQVWSHTFRVRAAQPLIPPLPIDGFTCDPPSPLATSVRSARLEWKLARDPDELILRNDTTGREWRLDPADRSFDLDRPMAGRARFTLKSILRDPDLGEEVSAERSQEVVVPGVTVLAGDVENLGSSYLKEAVPGVTPWGSVTGLAWKSPWLYFSQGDHHTIRRVQLTGTEVEEVAGRRGVPGQGDPQGRLYQPGQLIPRQFPVTGEGMVEDWLVLQTAANGILSFTEGAAETTLAVFGKEAELKAPAAMAVHSPTGSVFVADAGNRAIKLLSPKGDRVRTLTKGVEAGGIAVNDQGDVFYSDPANHVVMVLQHLGPALEQDSRYAPPAVFAGTPGRPGALDGGRITEARFRQPTGLAIESSPSRAFLVIADTGNHLVRRTPADLTPGLKVQTAGGNPHSLKTVDERMAVHPSGILAVVDAKSDEIRLHSADGLANLTLPPTPELHPRGVAMDEQGNLFLSDPGQHVVWVRRILGPLGMEATYGEPEVFAGRPGTGGKAEGERTAKALLQSPEGLALDPKDPRFLLITDLGNQVEWKVSVDLAQDLPVKSNGSPRPQEPSVRIDGLRDGLRADARFCLPRQLCADGHGRLFVQDQTGRAQSPLIRVIDPFGAVTTLGGSHANTTRRKRGEAGFDTPVGITVDGSGAIYVADSGNTCIRRIAPEGTLSVAAGSVTDADGTGDDGFARLARFSALGALGLDGKGRILAVEPGRGRLRMVDFAKESKESPEAGVTTVKSNLTSNRICVFPAHAGNSTPFVIAEPAHVPGEFALKLQSASGVELLNPRTPFQAMCADRLNRVWVVLPADPAEPGRLTLQRYSYREPRTGSTWDVEAASLDLLHPKDDRLPLEDRPPCAGCALPRITAMAADSRNHLFLADSESGVIWKVDTDRFNDLLLLPRPGHDSKEPKDPRKAKLPAMAIEEPSEDKACVSLVAGRYPYLGPIGPELHCPLLPMQGLAVTPDDDVVVTCGNAALKITRLAPPALDWTPKGVASPPRPKLAGGKDPAKSGPVRLRDPNQEGLWQRSLNKGAADLKAASNRMAIARKDLLEAQVEAKADPASREIKEGIEYLLRPQLAKDQRNLAIAEAGVKARKDGYAFLLLLDQVELNGGDRAPADLRASAMIAKAACRASQARFECLQAAKAKEDLPTTGPGRTVAQARMDYLQAIQEAATAEAEALAGERDLAALPKTGPRFDAVLARLTRAREAHERKLKDLALAEAAAHALDAAQEDGEKPGHFAPWTEKARNKKGDLEWNRPPV